MKAWRVLEFCEPDEMQLQEIEIPEPKAGEIRVKNHAAALNFFATPKVVSMAPLGEKRAMYL